MVARADEAARQVARWRDCSPGSPDPRPRCPLDPLGRRHAARFSCRRRRFPSRRSCAGSRATSARAWIFTSATLAVGEDFAITRRSSALADAGAAWDEPVRLPAPGAALRAAALPAPNEAEHTEAVVEAALPVLEASEGRAFLLFTTLRALRRARERLRRRCASVASTIRCWCRATGSRSQLLVRFRELGNAVLLGSAVFWEGVDVPGEALSLVVIDKLPFAPPDDPLLAARLEELRGAAAIPSSPGSCRRR